MVAFVYVQEANDFVILEKPYLHVHVVYKYNCFYLRSTEVKVLVLGN